MGKGLHVVRRGRKWGVLRAGGKRATSLHRTQRAAAAKAVRLAKKQRAEVLIHNLKGRIRSKDSYGNDPRSRRDHEH